MKLAFFSVFLQLPTNAPEPFNYYASQGNQGVELTAPIVPIGLAVEAGLVGFKSGSLAVGLSSDLGYYATDDVWPFRAVVDRNALDVGVRWDTCRSLGPAGVCFWYDLMAGPRLWVFAPTDWAGGLNGGVGLRTGVGLTLTRWKVRPSLGLEFGADVIWGSRYGTLELPDRSGSWDYAPGGLHGDLRVGIEL